MFEKWFKPSLFSQPKEEPLRGSALVVSDDAEHAAQICDALRQQGCEAWYTTSADETCKHIENHQMPTVIICDFAHPQVDAKRVVQQVSFRFGRSKMPPVIIFRDRPDDEMAARDLNASHVLVKPVDPNLVYERINLFAVR